MAVAAVLVVIALVSAIWEWSFYTFGSLDQSIMPSRLRVYGRTYRAAGGPEVPSAGCRVTFEPAFGT